jgi:hypothetical protein
MSSSAGLAASWVRISLEESMDICIVLRLSGLRTLQLRLILNGNRPEGQSLRVMEMKRWGI